MQIQIVVQTRKEVGEGKEEERVSRSRTGH